MVIDLTRDLDSDEVGLVAQLFISSLPSGPKDILPAHFRDPVPQSIIPYSIP